MAVWQRNNGAGLVYMVNVADGGIWDRWAGGRGSSGDENEVIAGEVEVAGTGRVWEHLVDGRRMATGEVRMRLEEGTEMQTVTQHALAFLLQHRIFDWIQLKGFRSVFTFLVKSALFHIDRVIQSESLKTSVTSRVTNEKVATTTECWSQSSVLSCSSSNGH